MRHVFGLVLCLCLSAPAAQAQNLISQYYAMIGPGDFFNSSGARLGDFGAILQQDRANLHRFGRPDAQDGWDPVFADAGNRSLIPQIWRIAPGFEFIPGWVMSGQPRFLLVQVYGYGTTPQVMVISDGAG